MMKCDKCHCETHVIYVTRGDGRVCDKCKVEMTRCHCCDELDQDGKHQGRIG